MTTIIEPQTRSFRERRPDGTYDVWLTTPQAEVRESRAPVTVMQAGTGSGKTCIGAYWLWERLKEFGPGDYLVAAPTYPLFGPRVLPELKEWFIHTGWGEFKQGSTIAPPMITSRERDGNNEPLYRIFLGSAKNPESLESATVKAAWIDELAQKQFTRQAWEAIQRRTAFYNAPVLGTTTLYGVTSWYKTDIYDPWVAGDERINIIMAASISNPAYPRDRFEYAQKTMPYWKFAMFHLGRYEKPLGVIYDSFHEDTQVIDRFAVPEEWFYYTGHDFGSNNTAAVGLAQDPQTGLMYVTWEYHPGPKSPAGHAQAWKDWGQGKHIMGRFGGSHQEEEQRNLYTAAGWPISEPPVRTVEAGIEKVYSWLARNQVFVFRDCHEFLEEILTYSRELDDNYAVTDIIQDKSRFHLMDSFRYLLGSLPTERVMGKSSPIMQKHYGENNRRTRREMRRLVRSS
jgi:hypothetical protein